MTTIRPKADAASVPGLAPGDTEVLSAHEERALLRVLHECRQKLAGALAAIPEAPGLDGADDPQALANGIASVDRNDPPTEARLGAVFCRYNEVRSRLALANLRLVGHVARHFRDRGIAYADLIQEGFCGLLEAIDRFDLSRETKLATYATWWIRQAIQRAVAAGAYPVRLSPRHLRQLARNQGDIERPANGGGPGGPSVEMIQRIHTATRPTVSLDAVFRPRSNESFNLLAVMSDRDGDQTEAVDLGETMAGLLDTLRPREREVLALRFGLGGQPRLSLSQVGKVMAVSKERVRQIQDRALQKLRGAAGEQRLDDLLPAGA
jgi:RNA polymerase primary sigma factor